MEAFDLSGIPIKDRELMEINQNQVMQILEEIERLKLIATNKADPKAAQSAKKRLTNATRALADVVETPELFAGYTPTKNIKYVGEGYYGVGKKFLEDMQLDPMGLTGGKSTMHHNDSLKQMFQAIYHPNPAVRYQVLQGLRESKEGDIGSTLKNLSDTEAKYGHRIYHQDPVTGLTDYKNKTSTVTGVDPNASIEERIIAGTRSIETQGKITKAAQESDIVVARNMSMLSDFARTPEGRQLLEDYGNPLDINNPKRTVESIKKFRALQTQFTPIIQKGGTVRFRGIVDRPEFKTAARYAPNTAAMAILGDINQGVNLQAGFGLDAFKMLQKNIAGATVGAVTALDPEAIKDLRKGQVGQAIEKTTLGAAVGAGLQQAAKGVTSLDTARMATTVSKIPGGVTLVKGAVKFAPPLAAAAAGYQVLDAFVTLGTGKTLQETGVAAEETKQKLREEGYSEYELRRRARTGYRKP